MLRGARAGLWAVLVGVAAQSCGFPDHSFVDDDEFYKKSDGSAGGGSSNGGSNAGGGASTGGSNAGGSVGGGGTTGESGGTNGGDGSAGDASTGSGGTGTGGVGNDGAIVGKPDSGPDAAGGAQGSGGGGSLDGGPDADGAPVCDPGFDLCFGVCVDLLGDDAHCGDCTTSCTGTDVCTAGVCKPPCAQGLTECQGACVDTDTDGNHCGSCIKQCGNGQVCEGGVCLKDCGSLARCGAPPGDCYDTSNDNDHCGDCSTSCTSQGKICSGGVCQPNCTGTFTLCNNACVDFNLDDANCGGCGPSFACGQQQACIGGSCQDLTEDCQNGSDDDRDGKIDCDDADCDAGYTCAAIPSGWQGPVALWTGASGGSPSCSTSGGYGTDFLDAHSGLVAPPSSCPDCTCTPSGATCNSIARMWFDNTTTCTASLGYAYTIPASGSCVSNFMGDHVQSLQFIQQSGQPPIASGSCVGTTPTPQFPAATWTGDLRACGGSASAGGGCVLGQCLPRPAAPFGAQLCVFRAGVTTCPTGYPNALSTSYYQTWQEGRYCSACNCGSVTCGGSLKLFSDTGCTTDATTVPFDGTCTTISADPTPGTGKSDTRSLQWQNAAPQCGSSPSNLLGAPQPSDPVTVCCQ